MVFLSGQRVTSTHQNTHDAPYNELNSINNSWPSNLFKEGLMLLFYTYLFHLRTRRLNWKENVKTLIWCGKHDGSHNIREDQKHENLCGGIFCINWPDWKSSNQQSWQQVKHTFVVVVVVVINSMVLFGKPNSRINPVQPNVWLEIYIIHNFCLGIAYKRLSATKNKTK